MSQYNFLEMLIRSVEEPHKKPEDTDATIRKLRNEYVEAMAEITALREARQEAKAEIERLRGQVEFWERRYKEAERGFVVERKAMIADAEIGRLVRGMEIGTRLCREQSPITGTPGWASRMLRRGLWALVKVSLDDDDPAEALRSIQASE